MSKHWDSGKMVRGRFGKRGPMRELERRASAPDVPWTAHRTSWHGFTRPARPKIARRSVRRGLSARQAALLRPFVLLWIFAGTAGALTGLGAFDGARLPAVTFAAGSSAAVSGARIAGTGFPDGNAPVVRADFSLCHTGGGYNCVVDGDTIWLEGQNIRLADIDSPETHEPRCAEEQERGDRATLRLQQLLNGGQVALAAIDRDEDVYGRKLRIVEVDGDSVGDTLVGEGLARWYAGRRRGWC